MKVVGLDFETRSKTDIKDGVHQYASCPSTDILCLCVIDENTGAEWLWFPHEGSLPTEARQTIIAADIVKAHNAAFDKAIWEMVGVWEYGFPELTADVWYCTSAQCRVNALPASLDDAAKAAGIKKRKDPRGGALIRLLSIPNKEGEFNEDPAALVEMGEYCVQDTRLMVQLSGMLRSLSKQEHDDWLMTEELNERGAKVDVELAKLAITYAEDEKDAIAARLHELTGGVITKHTQSVRARNWLLEQCDDPALRKLMTVHKDGVEKLSMDKGIRATIIDAEHYNDLTIPMHCIEVVKLIDQGNKASVSKFERMVGMADEEDHRVRGAFVFAGAGQTQRYASRGLQLHNMRRDCWSVAETLELKADMAEDYEIDDVMNTLSKLLRPTIIPEDGKIFVVCDWAAIEGRVLPWLTADPRAEEVLDIFRADEDIYMHTAESMNITDRQTGKVATLALGYQGALGAFSVMAKAYGLVLPESRILAIVKAWRRANQWAVDFWANCEKAAIKAMRNAGEYIPIGRCNFVYIECLLGGTLCTILPDNTILQYPKARLDYVETKWGGKHQVSYMKASITAKADATEWPRHTLYGGIIAENMTQAVAGCLLRDSLRQLDDVVLHVHDEIVVEVDEPLAQHSATILQSVMETPPAWAEGLPLKAVPEFMERYGK